MVGVNFDILRGIISLPLDLSISYCFFVVNNFFCEHNNTKKLPEPFLRFGKFALSSGEGINVNGIVIELERIKLIV